MKGQRNPRAILTPEQVATIRAEYTPGPIGRPPRDAPKRTTLADLAERFGVTKSSIYHAYRDWTWKG